MAELTMNSERRLTTAGEGPQTLSSKAVSALLGIPGVDWREGWMNHGIRFFIGVKFQMESLLLPFPVLERSCLLEFYIL